MAMRSWTKGKSGAWSVITILVALTLVVAQPLPAGAYHDEIVHKLAKGRTELVSVSSQGEQGDGDSGAPGGEPPQCQPSFGQFSASDDGRFVAFKSRAGNLHPADVNGRTMLDVFVFDRRGRKLDLVSAMPHGLAGQPPVEAPDQACLGSFGIGFVGSSNPVISGNGRYVVFESNLPLTGIDEPEARVPGYKIFVRDLKRQKTELVSRSQDGRPVYTHLEFDWGGPDISDDGRFVAFRSWAPNVTEEACQPVAGGVEVPLVAGCDVQVFVRDRKRNETVLASRSNSGYRANELVGHPFISGNGRHVAFTSRADNLLDGGSHGAETDLRNVFLHDLRTRSTELISVSRDGTPANRSINGGPGFWKPQLLSNNGRFVAFFSDSTNIVPNPGQEASRLYVRDRKEGRTERVSVTSTGTPFSNQSQTLNLSITDDGRHVLVFGTMTPLVLPALRDPAPHGGGNFLFDRRTGQTDWVMGSGDPPDSRAGDFEQIGGNGRFIVFTGSDGDPPRVPEDSNGFTDVFVRDIERRPLGTGGYGDSPPNPQPPGDDPPLICVEGTCIPPQSAISSSNTEGDLDDALANQGAKLYGASLAYRPELEDLFAAIELEHMGPSLPVSIPGLATAPTTPILYGLRFETKGKSYEVRVSSLAGGTFGLFDCTETAPLCTQVAALKGGYGTTGERAVFSLPLDQIGLEEGGELTDVVAFTAIGNYGSGAMKVLDRVRLK